MRRRGDAVILDDVAVAVVFIVVLVSDGEEARSLIGSFVIPGVLLISFGDKSTAAHVFAVKVVVALTAPVAVAKYIFVVFDLSVLVLDPLDDAQPHHHLPPHAESRRSALLVLLSRPLCLVLGQLLHDLVVVLLRDDYALDHGHGHPVAELEVNYRLGKVDAQPLANLDGPSVWHVRGTDRAHVLSEQVDVAIFVLRDDAVLDGRRYDPIRLVETVEAL